MKKLPTIHRSSSSEARKDKCPWYEEVNGISGILRATHYIAKANFQSTVLLFFMHLAFLFWLTYKPVCFSILQRNILKHLVLVKFCFLFIRQVQPKASQGVLDCWSQSRLTECLKKDFITEHPQAVQQVVSWVSINRDEQSHPLQKHLPNLLPLAFTDVCVQSSSLILFTFPSEN